MSKSTELHKAEHRIITVGTTGAATRVKITVNKYLGNAYSQVRDASVRVKVANKGTLADATYATIAPSNGSVTAQTITATKELIISPVLVAAAVGTLTISGVVIHGQTVTIGTRVYQFVAGAAATGSNVAVNVAASMTAAAGTLTVDTQPTVGDTMTVGSRTYSFVALGTGNADGEIALGANVAATKPLIVAAINGTDGWNVANTLVTAAAFSGDNCVITARIEGTVGNAYATTETFAAGTNVFDAATLGTTTAGVDCSAAAAVTALAAAITADASAVVTAADGAGNTVDVVAKVPGEAGNDIATTETMTNGAWGAATLASGADAVPGSIYVDITNTVGGTVDLIISTAPFGPTISVPRRIAITHAAA